MTSSYIDAIEQSLLASGLAERDAIRGCNESEIRELEQLFGLTFPRVYREFLQKMGRQAGRLFLGSDVFLGRIRELRQYAEEILKESSTTFRLPVNCHVFLSHQGYVFLYFVADSQDDPAVYRFVEGERAPTRVNSSFSSFLEDSVHDAGWMASERKAYRKRHGLEGD